jgi:hypothetical protein
MLAARSKRLQLRQLRVEAHHIGGIRGVRDHLQDVAACAVLLGQRDERTTEVVTSTDIATSRPYSCRTGAAS